MSLNIRQITPTFQYHCRHLFERFNQTPAQVTITKLLASTSHDYEAPRQHKSRLRSSSRSQVTIAKLLKITNHDYEAPRQHKSRLRSSSPATSLSTKCSLREHLQYETARGAFLAFALETQSQSYKDWSRLPVVRYTTDPHAVQLTSTG